MKEKVEKIAALLDKFLRQELSPEEKTELDNWIAEGEKNRLLFQQLTDKKILAEKLKRYENVDSEALWQDTLRKISTGGKVIEMPRKPVWRRYIAAAIVIGLLAGGWYYTSTLKSNSTQPDAVVQATQTSVQPGSNKAVLTLVDGKKIELKAGENTAIPRQGQNEVSITNEGLLYTVKTEEGENAANGDLTNQYNVVATPRGGQYQVTLPDGSKVWLNSASSLRFPIVFAGNERHVQLTGEAYFEVTQQQHTSKTPFIVTIINKRDSKKECDVEVLGTHFNIMAYEDEASTQTTLAEGSVKIIRGQATRLIKPNQQASVENEKITVKSVDAEDITAWKKGLISFDGGNTQMVLRQLGRWYDVEIVYEGTILPGGKAFDGKLNRNAPIDSNVKVLQNYNVNARLEGRKLIVTP